VYSEYHFVTLRDITEGLVLVTEPQELALAVTLANVNAEVHKRLVNITVHSVRVCLIGRTLDGDCSLIVGRAGRTPRTVLLLNTERNLSIIPDTVVTACSPSGRETGANTLC